MKITNLHQPVFKEECDKTHSYKDGVELPPPNRFISSNTQGRLIPKLINIASLAASGKIFEVLREAAMAHYKGDKELAMAMADLTVTGRAAYTAFRSQRPRIRALLRFIYSKFPNVNRRLMWQSAGFVLDRAYLVLWEIVVPSPDRIKGWFAVAGDTDPPHRLVNFPATGYNQYELTVLVNPYGAAKGRKITTRFSIWDKKNRTNRYGRDIKRAANRRMLPSVPRPVFRSDTNYLIYIHGLGSGLEEPGRLAEALQGSSYTIISMDLPNSGCAELIDHLEIADTSNYRSLEKFPILDFVEQFVVDFILSLSSRYYPKLLENISAVMGGSLGGNTTLRLAGRDHDQIPWLRNFIPWSAASVWNPAVNIPRNAAYERPWADMLKPETPESRVENIEGTYQKKFFPLSFTIASTWYCNCYEPCKQRILEVSLLGAQQGYHELKRKWGARLAAEQMIFSHVNPRSRLAALTGRMQLLAGDDDNYMGVHIFDATNQLATRAVGSKGVLRLLSKTGHSIHEERPKELAALIQSFLPPRYPGSSKLTWEGWQSIKGQATSSPVFATNEDGSLELFIRNQHRLIQSIRQEGPNGGWEKSVWMMIASGLGRGTQFGEHIAVERKIDGALEMFCELSREGWIAHVWQDRPNGRWGRWATGTHLSQLIGRATDSAFVVSRVAEGQRIFDGNMLTQHTRLLLVGTRTIDGPIHVRGQNRIGGWWMNGKNVADDGQTFTGVPCAINSMSGKTYILAMGSDKVIRCASMLGDDEWDSRWVKLNGCVVGSDVSCELDANGDIWVAAQNIGGELVLTKNSRDRNAWDKWQTHAAQIHPGTKPIIIRNPWGELQVFVTWKDGSIRTKRQILGTPRTWTSWENIGGKTNRAPGVAANVNGLLTVAITGIKGEVWLNTMT